MSTLTRTIRNTLRVGLKDFGKQLQYIGDTKSGTLIGTDRFHNKYYENTTEELPLRTRWVEYANASVEVDPATIEPGWHAWMSYMVKDPPATGGKAGLGILGGERGTRELGGVKGWEMGKADVGEGDKVLSVGVRDWEMKEPRGNLTQTRGAYRPYSTVKPKIGAWTPVTKPR